MSAESVIDLIREVGVFRLGCTDGCLCMDFAVRGVSVDLHCHRTMGGRAWANNVKAPVIRAYSSHSEIQRTDLPPIAAEVERQLRAHEYFGGYEKYTVRFCSYDQDEALECIYCGSPRVEATGYYCAEHGPHNHM